MLPKCLLLGLAGFAVTACSQAPADRVNEIASEFVHGYYMQFPEEVYEVGYPDSPTDRFGDHSPETLAAWDVKVNGWLNALDEIDIATLAGTPEAITWVFAHERLQALVDWRICQNALWNVSPTYTGWQFMIAGTLAIQPVSTGK
ncbi:MAG: hypothetical protein OEU90_15090, partial [Gammaproteobacteria bacterium]|nr:hypothetical protein [Gammaproteobacteria bacterium]